MATWEFNEDVRCAVLDPSQFMDSPEIAELHNRLVQRYGLKVMRDAEKKQDRELKRGTAKAKAYVEAHLNYMKERPLAAMADPQDS